METRTNEALVRDDLELGSVELSDRELVLVVGGTVVGLLKDMSGWGIGLPYVVDPVLPPMFQYAAQAIQSTASYGFTY